MNENLDLTEILKDCPKGMELDCTMYDNVTFVEVCKDTNTLYPIYCITTDENGNRSGCSFTKNGYASPRNSAKCVIFPKGKTTWEGFQRPFVDGDILYARDEGIEYIFILKHIFEHGRVDCYLSLKGDDLRLQDVWLTDYNPTHRLATEEEKQKLFDVIKKKGYKWNADTKTLEKLIVPKFKVGDKVRNKANGRIVGTIIALYKEVYEVKSPLGNEFSIDFISQDRFELVPNKFDPKTLQPFDKVLVRDSNNQKWMACLFSHIDNTVHHQFRTVDRAGWYHCIPFNDDTKHLIGKTDETPEFYRYWEE